jgi:hypothetical protein
VSIAGAGNREPDPVVTFAAVPGPARVTAGQAVAYTATFANKGHSTLTHVEFHMEIPTAKVGSVTSPATLVSSSCAAKVAQGELVCTFDKLKSGNPPIIVSTVWLSPQIGPSCEDCLSTKGFWRADDGDDDRGRGRGDKGKDGGRDDKAGGWDDRGHGDDPKTFPAGGITVTVSLLANDDPNKAGSFETSGCSDPLGAGSLSTNTDVDASNPVASTVCLPAFTTGPTTPGVATTIEEVPAAAGDPGHPALGRALVCVAAFGQSCGAEGTYTPFDFGIATPIQFVFRISNAALKKGEKITKVFHNRAELPKCPSANPNGCVVMITPPKSRYAKHGGPSTEDKGVWTVVARSPTNGSWDW